MSSKAFLETLWNRMAQQGDFPTLQYSIDNISKTLNGDLSVGEMATSVLSDFSLSQKMIRLANSAMYRSFGGEVTTVSRAILVLGVDAISHLTLGVQLLDYFHGAAPKRPEAAKALKQAVIAGEITRALNNARGINDGEEAVVCTLMHHISRLLLIFYFPAEWERVEALRDGQGLEEGQACKEVFGISLEEVGAAAAVKWRLPTLIAKSMTRTRPTDDTELETHADWLGAMGWMSSQAAAAVLRGEPDDAIQEALMSHAVKLGLEAADVEGAIRQATSLNASLTRTGPDETASALPRQHVGKPSDALDRLNQAVAEVRREGPDASVAQLAPLVLESAMRALNFSRCFMMLLNPAAKRFGARLGFGEGMREKLDALAFEERFVPDIFHFASIAQEPLFFADTFEPQVAQRVPRWYRETLPDARSVLLAPVKVRNRCVALICGDWGPTPCAEDLTVAELEAVDRLAQEMSTGFLRYAGPR
jgi:HD-like signal output (HDOD) protein